MDASLSLSARCPRALSVLSNRIYFVNQALAHMPGHAFASDSRLHWCLSEGLPHTQMPLRLGDLLSQA